MVWVSALAEKSSIFAIGAARVIPPNPKEAGVYSYDRAGYNQFIAHFYLIKPLFK